MVQVLKRIVRAEIPAVLIEDLGVFLRHKGDSRDLLAADYKNRTRFTVQQICKSNSLDNLVKRGFLTLWDEDGLQITGDEEIEKATNVATLRNSGSGGVGAIAKRVIQESFTASGGEVSFTLTNTPLYENGVIMFVNGNNQVYGTDYTASGTTVTWSGFTLESGDQINFSYEVLI